VLFFAAMPLAGQTAAKPKRASQIESRQGNHPDGPDQISHGTVASGDTLLCMLVEVYDESHQTSTACVVQFTDGPKRTLAFDESMTAAQDGEALLECAGDKPGRCAVKVNPPTTKPSSDIR
jgi:hypothetical protein